MTTSRLDKSKPITNNIGNLNSSSALGMSDSVDNEENEDIDSQSHSQSILSLRGYSTKNIISDLVVDETMSMFHKESHKEKNMIQLLYPSVWTASLVKTGKMLALFDKA